MQILEVKQQQLSNLSKNREEFESLLNLNIDKEYEREVFRILDIYGLKLNELETILKNQENLIEKAIVKHQEIKSLLSQIAKLAYKFEKYEITELLLDKIKVIEIGIIFIINNYLVEEKLSKKHKEHQVDSKIKKIQEIVSLIKSNEEDYLTIKHKELLVNPVLYYFYVIININNEIAKTETYLKEKNKKEIERKIDTLKHQKEILVDLVYTFINFLKKDDRDLIISLANISWDKYENISETIGDTSWCKISYLDGVLELRSPSIYHEELSENFTAIITEYCFRKSIDCFGIRSTRLKSKNKKGKEPDVSYALYQKKKTPDIAVEVNYTSGNIKDLDIYLDIGVAEVWIYDLKNKTRFYLLEKDNYREIKKSKHFELLTPDIVNNLLEIGKNKGIVAIKKEVIDYLDSH